MKENKMEAKEFSDKTVEKAVKAACDHFNCKKEDLKIEIITRGSTGLFGLGGRKAKIQAMPCVKTQEKTAEENKGTDSLQEVSSEKRSSQASPTPDKDEISPPPEGPGEGEKQVRSAPETGGHTKKAAAPKGRKQKKEEVPPEIVEKRLAAACDIANQILKKSGLEGEADTVEQSSRPYINITGSDLSLIIGKEGRTLDALEYLVNLCLKKMEPDINYRVQLDAGGYRERRRKSLVTLAEKMAQKARKTGKAVSLQPMPARERRVIHIALRSARGIKTYSSGEGGGRKVVIAPSHRKRRAGRNRNNAK